jgi:hypothetical protein
VANHSWASSFATVLSPSPASCTDVHMNSALSTIATAAITAPAKPISGPGAVTPRRR